MSEKSRRCIAWVLRQEGGYKPQTPGDPETYRGLSRVANPDWPGWRQVDARKPIPRGTVFPELDELVIDRYESRYWGPALERLPEALALVQLDFLVNSGAAPALLAALEADLGRSPTPEEVIQTRGHYMIDMACGFVSQHEARVTEWTSDLPGWMKRLRDNLLAVRTMKKGGA